MRMHISTMVSLLFCFFSIHAIPAYVDVGGLPAQTVKAYETADVHAGVHDVPVRFLGFQRMDLSVMGQDLLQPHDGEFGINPGPDALIKRWIYAKLAVRAK